MAGTTRDAAAKAANTPPPGDSVLCPAPNCWHPINSHVVDKGGCRARTLGGVRLCQCKRTPNEVALAVIAGIS